MCLIKAFIYTIYLVLNGDDIWLIKIQYTSTHAYLHCSYMYIKTTNVLYVSTNVELSPLGSSDIRLTAISQEILQPLNTGINFKITCLKFCSNLPGTNELPLQ